MLKELEAEEDLKLKVLHDEVEGYIAGNKTLIVLLFFFLLKLSP